MADGQAQGTQPRGEAAETVWSSASEVEQMLHQPWDVETRRKGMTKTALYEEAKEAGIEGRSKMSRDELEAALHERDR